MSSAAFNTLQRQDEPRDKFAVKSRRPVGRVAAAILQKVWRLHLERSGFDDIESERDPDGPLSNRGQASNLRNRRVSGAEARRVNIAKRIYSEIDVDVPLDDEARMLHIESTAEYYRRCEHLADRFDDPKNRAVAVAISEGWSFRLIERELRVCQVRIMRVRQQLRDWMKERESDEQDQYS